MKALVGMLVILLPVIIAFYAGRWTAAPNRDRLSRGERKELNRLRDLRYRLTSTSAEHSLLGDNYAIIVQGLLDETRKAISE